MLAFGINHHTAPLVIREKLVFQADELPGALRALAEKTPGAEAVILSTCNRTEIYTTHTDHHKLQQWMARHKNIAEPLFQQHSYAHHGRQAIKHMMRVASGLDSLVLGEPQVLGQVKTAFSIAENTGSVGEHFRQIFPAVFSASKGIRANTAIGKHPVSLAYTVMQLAQKACTPLTEKQVLFVGAGEIITLVAKHFYDAGIRNIIFANRSRDKLIPLTQSVNAKSIALSEMNHVLKTADVIITATASTHPILTKKMITAAQRRSEHPLLLIDLALPRDIHHDVTELLDITLYNMDDLKTIISKNLLQRKAAITEAELMIDCHLAQLEKKLRIYQTREVITQYRQRLETMRDDELKKAMAQLQRGMDPKTVLETFGHQLINKIMHHPTVKLREAASEEECVLLQQIKDFFG